MEMWYSRKMDAELGVLAIPFTVIPWSLLRLFQEIYLVLRPSS